MIGLSDNNVVNVLKVDGIVMVAQNCAVNFRCSTIRKRNAEMSSRVRHVWYIGSRICSASGAGQKIGVNARSHARLP